MLSTVLAHAGLPLEPHDAWWAWNLDPLTLVLMAGVALAYRTGWRHGVDTPSRRVSFWSGMVALVAALLSPLDAMSGVLVSAHMVQHVLLVLVAAPLLAASAPGGAILRGLPGRVRTAARDVRRTIALDAGRLRLLRSPVARWLLYVATLWIWHASVVYGAAVEHEVVHAVEHAAFLATGFLVWAVLLGPARVRVARGLAVLGVFTLGLQGIFLSVLLTFASEPFYAEHLAPPAAWGIDPLTDQRLAGVILWVPAGMVHLGIALWLFVTWLTESEADDRADRRGPVPAPGRVRTVPPPSP